MAYLPAIIDSVPGNLRNNYICHVYGNIYAVVSVTSSGSILKLDTYKITSAAITIIESFTVATVGVTSGFPKIIKLGSSTYYAIVYQDADNDGQLLTITISNLGTSITSVASLEFDTGNGKYPDIINISGNVYAIVYESDANDGWIKTYTLSSVDGSISAMIDSYEFSLSCQFPEIVNVSGAIYAIVFRDLSDDGQLITTQINADGTLGKTVIDALTFIIATSTNLMPEIISISGSVFAIVAGDDTGADAGGFLYTISIDSSGVIDPTIIGTYEFETGACASPIIRHIIGTDYLITYTGPDNDGFAIVIAIANNGVIGAISETFEFDTSNGSAPYPFVISSLLIVIAYGQSSSGLIITIGTAGVTYPTDDMARISGIIHRYDTRKEVYQAEVTLGGTISRLVLPYDSLGKRTTEERNLEQNVQIAVDAAERRLNPVVEGIEKFKEFWKRQIRGQEILDLFTSKKILPKQLKIQSAALELRLRELDLSPESWQVIRSDFALQKKLEKLLVEKQKKSKGIGVFNRPPDWK